MNDLTPENLTLEQLPKAFAQFLTEWQKDRHLLLEKGSINPISTDTWFNLTELCQYLPDKPAKPTVYSYVQNRKIPFHKKGKALFFLKSEIDLYLKSGRRRTSTEISAEVDQYFTSSNQ